MIITIPGPCVPKGRARSGQGHHYTPDKTRSYETYVKQIVAAEMKRQGWKRITGPIEFTLRVYRHTPKAIQKKYDKEGTLIWCITRPDLDNYEKCVQDALNGIAYNDDSQVCKRGQGGKFYDYGRGEGIEIELRELQ
jgi:Holliday junction resolvase RusA-like endonuclease